MNAGEQTLRKRPLENAISQGSRLDELYSQHSPGALRLAFLLTGRKDLAEDLVQDAFVRVAARFHDIRNWDSFGAYLRRAVVNLANTYFRRRKLERDYLETYSRGHASNEEELPDVARQHDLRKALYKLPIRQRTAIVLRYYEDLSEDQTAELLGCSVGAVKSLVLRGMASLRQDVRREEA